MKKNKITYILFSLLLLVMIESCSTTKRIEDGELLYTGVKKMEILSNDSTDLPGDIEDKIKEVLSVAPNNPLFSPYVRSPLPIGLWVYNNWNITPKSSGIKKWLYNQLVREPILISTVRPELKMEVVKNILDNNGYFGSSARYELISGKNPKKARLSYFIKASEPYKLSSVELIPGNDELTNIIDSLAVKSGYLKRDRIFSVDSLNAVRTEIANYLHDHGYYYFRPEHIEYQADSLMEPGKIAVRMMYAGNVQKECLRKYYINTITTTVHRNDGGGTPDTTYTEKKGKVIQMCPSRLRKQLVPSCITMKEGSVLSVSQMNRAQNYLSRIGIFRSINMDVTPLDSLKENQDSLDIRIDCVFDSPIEVKLELNAAYKSNSFLGPGIGVGIAHNNLFGGGERLSFELTGSYEWQIGKSVNGGDNNYYELGVTTALAFPRILAPRFMKGIKRELNWTEISLSANLYNNPSSLKYLQLSAALTYKWRANRDLSHELELPRFTFSKRLRAGSSENMSEEEQQWDEYVHRSEFIPKIGYTVTYDKTFGRHRENNIVLRASVSESGNIFSGIWALCGNGKGVGSKELFGVPFSQYAKVNGQFIYSRKFLKKHSIVAYLMTGAGFVYGNSAYMPYGEDFYAGGPNNIRAFGINSLGPGSFKDFNGYDSQFLHSGSFQLLMNLEYRFPIFGFVHGAAFVDAGNVWLLKDPNNMYPGSVLKGSTFFDDIALGTGIGLRLDFDMIVIRADLGVGIHAPYDTGKSSYYNMPSFKESLALNLAIGYPF